jgi:hypothetical protein
MWKYFCVIRTFLIDMELPAHLRRECAHDAVRLGRCIGCDAEVGSDTAYRTVCGAGGAGAIGVKGGAAAGPWGVVFDLDETLVHALRTEDAPADTVWLSLAGVRMGVIVRSGAVELVRGCARLRDARLWVFTLGTLVYAREVVRALVALAGDIPPGEDGLGPFSGQVVARETSTGFVSSTWAAGVHKVPEAPKGLWVFGMPAPDRCVILDDRPENWVPESGSSPLTVFVPPVFTVATPPDAALGVFLRVVQCMASGLSRGAPAHLEATRVAEELGAALHPLVLRLKHGSLRLSLHGNFNGDRDFNFKIEDDAVHDFVSFSKPPC